MLGITGLVPLRWRLVSLFYHLKSIKINFIWEYGDILNLRLSLIHHLRRAENRLFCSIY